MAKIKLNQVVAIEKGVKTRVYGEITSLHKKTQKEDNFNGFTKSFKVLNEDEPSRPSEEKLVQISTTEALEAAQAHLTELFDVTATKDFGNMVAKADVEVDGKVLLMDAPVPYLLFLEKQLNDVYTFVEKMPVLDKARAWGWDASAGLFRSDTVASNSTKKVPKVIVKYEATEHHPAQTELISVDELVGRWDTTHLSGAFEAPRKKEILSRIVALKKAVQQAREKANGTDVDRITTAGQTVFGYLFG